MVHTPFHGLTQAGRQPSMQFQQLNQAYQSDPRRILGQALMQQGASTAPVRTPLQGLGRLSSALVGAYLQRKAGDTQVEREADYERRLGDALSGLDLGNVPGLSALSEVNPLAALTAGVGLEGQLAVAEAKRPKPPKTLTREEAIAAGVPTAALDRGTIFQLSPTSGLTAVTGTQGPAPGNREREFASMRAYALTPPGERTQDQILEYAQNYGYYSKPQNITVTSPSGEVQQIRTTPLDLAGIGLPQPVTMTGEPIESTVREEVLSTKQPTLDTSTAIRLGQVNFSLDELADVKKTLFPNGQYNQSVVYGATGAGSILSSKGRLLRQQIGRVMRDLIYLESGAQVGVEEAEEAGMLYFPSPLDNSAAAKAKLDALIKKMTFFQKALSQGRGAAGVTDQNNDDATSAPDDNQQNQSPLKLTIPGTGG